MPKLANPKLEAFAQKVAAGATLAAAYKAATGRDDRQYASKVAKRPLIAERIREIAADRAAKAAATIASVPSPPDRTIASDFEREVYKSVDAARAVGDHRAATAALKLLTTKRARAEAESTATAKEPPPRRLYYPEAIGLPAGAGVTTVTDALLRAIATPEQIAADEAERAEDLRRAAATKAWTDKSMAEYRARLAATPEPGEETPAQRVARAEAKRQPVV
jgi:hypothetical protein